MKLGFIGLGVMGGHMSRHLAQVHEVHVFDVARERISAVNGALGAAGVKDVGNKSDLVMLSLPNSQIVKEVVVGSEGLLGALAAGKGVIDLSTTEPLISQSIAVELAKRDIDFLDAPVSGGEGGARDATLSILVGGDQAVFDRYKSILEIIGGSVVRLGDIGAGGVAKLANNMIVGSTFTVIAEAFALAEKAGIDIAKLYEAIKGGWAGSAVLEVAGPGTAARDFEPGGTVDMNYKDIVSALSLARSFDVPTPMTAMSAEVFKAARASGRGGKAQHVVIELWEKLLGLDSPNPQDRDH